MASFVVETYVPSGNRDRFEADADGIRAAAEAITADGQIHHLRSYLVPGDEMGYHVIEAGSAEDVARVTELVGIQAERIVEAIRIEPSLVVDPGGTEARRKPLSGQDH